MELEAYAAARAAPKEPGQSRATDSGRRPALALAAVVMATFVLYVGLTTLVSVPRVHPDELRYALGASALVEGEGLHLRGQDYGFGLAHVALLAAILRAAGDPETAYPLWKLANALLFALAAIPIYLLARRLLRPWWSVGVAALALAIPSSIYTSVVMTESMSYFACLLAVYAIVLAVERSSVVRQFGAIAAIGLAYGARAQFGVLFVAFLGALVGARAVSPKRPRLRVAVAELWPTLTVLVIGGVALVARPLLTGSSPSESLGPYWNLWRGYDVLSVAKWTVYHAADLEMYLAVVPVAVAPIVLWRLLARGAEGAVREASFAVSFIAVNLGLLLVTAAFASTPVGYDRLHDRYLFYVVPLWLIIFAVWIADGLPRPLVATATGIALALVLPAILPFRQLANEAGVDTVPGALWVRLEAETAGPGPLSGSRVLAVFVIALLAAAVFLPRRLRIALPAAVLVVFAATSVLAWDRMIGAPEDAVFAGGLERAWIDNRLPEDAVVTKLYIESARCPTSTVTRHALFLTEFFNAKVDRAAYIGDSVPDGIPLDRVDVQNGRLVLESGAPLVADYVFTQPGIELNGRRVAVGTNANLVLWRIGGPVSVVGARTNEDVRTVDCA